MTVCCAVLCCVCVLQWHAGDNVGTGDDYTIFSKVEGIVIYSKRPGRNLVSSNMQPGNSIMGWGVLCGAPAIRA